MRKLLATLLILCAGHVWAEWLPATHVLEDGTQHFIDPSTIKGTHTKKFWVYAYYVMTRDRVSPEEVGDLSSPSPSPA